MQHGFRLYPLIAITLVAAASLWLERTTRVDEPSADSAQRSGPDFTATHTRTLSFAADGSPTYELQAEELLHFPALAPGQSEQTQLEQPHLTLNQPGSQLRISSARALVSARGEQVDFSGDVRIVRQPAGNVVAQQLSTAALTVWPDAQRATTAHPVTLKQGNTQASALGLQADNLMGTLELKGQVKAHLSRRQDPRS